MTVGRRRKPRQLLDLAAEVDEKRVEPDPLPDVLAPCLFRGGLVFKAHRLLYHSTLGLGVIEKKRGTEVDERGVETNLLPDVLAPRLSREVQQVINSRTFPQVAGPKGPKLSFNK